MIYKGGIEMSARYYGLKAVTAVYKGAKLVWEAISSCFGSGRKIRTVGKIKTIILWLRK